MSHKVGVPDGGLKEENARWRDQQLQMNPRSRSTSMLGKIYLPAELYRREDKRLRELRA